MKEKRYDIYKLIIFIHLYITFIFIIFFFSPKFTFSRKFALIWRNFPGNSNQFLLWFDWFSRLSRLFGELSTNFMIFCNFKNLDKNTRLNFPLSTLSVNLSGPIQVLLIHWTFNFKFHLENFDSNKSWKWIFLN